MMIKPYWEDTKNGLIIYNADCLDVLGEMENKSFGLVVTSPPFNLGNTHHTGNVRHNAYKDDMPEDKYQKWQIKILNSLPIKEDGSIFYQHKNRIKNGMQITPYEWIFKTNLIIKQELVWFNRSQNFDKCRFYPMTERIYWLSKSKDVNFKNNVNAHDLFRFNPVGINEKHSRAYPESLVKTFLMCVEGVVLDPFLGSGTTAVACKELGRKCIGIEISQKYCDTAITRLKNTQKSMF